METSTRTPPILHGWASHINLPRKSWSASLSPSFAAMRRLWRSIQSDHRRRHAPSALLCSASQGSSPANHMKMKKTLCPATASLRTDRTAFVSPLTDARSPTVILFPMVGCSVRTLSFLQDCIILPPGPHLQGQNQASTRDRRNEFGNSLYGLC